MEEFWPVQGGGYGDIVLRNPIRHLLRDQGEVADQREGNVLAVQLFAAVTNDLLQDWEVHKRLAALKFDGKVLCWGRGNAVNDFSRGRYVQISTFCAAVRLTINASIVAAICNSKDKQACG